MYAQQALKFTKVSREATILFRIILKTIYITDNQ